MKNLGLGFMVVRLGLVVGLWGYGVMGLGI